MKKIILIDGNSIMYRAYYATAATGNLMKNSKGLYTNAIYGFANMMQGIMKEKFDNILVAFDAGKKTFRHDILSDYKGGRSPMPDEMRSQIPYIKELLKKMGIPQYEIPLYEADDIIGTMANKAKNNGYNVSIYSSDKDLLQLVDDKVLVNLCKKGIQEMDTYDKQAIINRYGLTNKQMIDLKALMGDASDNLKGVPGVGEKTAIKLLTEYESLENIIENRMNIKGKLGEKIQNSYEDALVCKRMVTINQDSPIEISLEDTLYKGYNDDELRNFYSELEFHSFIKKMKASTNDFSFKKIDSAFDLSKILINNSALYIELDNYNYHKANIIGFGLANELGSFYIPFDMLYQSIDFQMFLEEDNHKIVFGLKKMIVSLKKLGFNIKGVDMDILLASYVIDPSLGKEDLKIIASLYDYDSLEYDEVIYGKGAKYQIPNDDILGKHLAQKAFTIYTIKNNVYDKLVEYQQLDLLQNVEMKLAYVLASMEMDGMKISKDELGKQQLAINEKISNLENTIYEIAGYKFNIASTKQLAELLFEKLNLPCSKKTKTGYSTDSQVLEGLADAHPIVKHILEYRALTKLSSTYIEGINNAIYDDGLIHTIFEQALTQTGRLSSIEPNLQNIPVRTEMGKEIRKMFVPKFDKLLSSDYSQIELRVLAHMANVEPLIEAFNEGHDIHRETAKKVFETDDVTPDLRHRAKAVNFGIIYGISPWGLATDLNISQKHAKEIIEKYLETYPEIPTFMDQTKEFALKNGYVLTILNRRRYIKEITSSNFMVREFGKRTAMNAPIQGSAADIIKLAMIDIYEEFKKQKLESQMICQVHDELIFDCKDSELERVIEIVKDKMNNAYKLAVPLEVDYGIGNDWFEVK